MAADITREPIAAADEGDDELADSYTAPPEEPITPPLKVTTVSSWLYSVSVKGSIVKSAEATGSHATLPPSSTFW